MKTFWFRAGIGAALAVACAQSPAFAQRAVQSPSAAMAAPGTAPEGMPDNSFVYGGEITSHLQGEITKAPHAPARAAAFDDTDAQLYANYSSWLSLFANPHLERNRNDNANSYYPRSDGLFRSEGLTLRQAFVTVRPVDEVAVYGGKIHPNFGWAWSAVPGNFYNFGSDYEQTERIGLGAEYRLPEWIGLTNARISLESHYLDTSALSVSLISQPKLTDTGADRRWRYRRDQFGPANTGRLDSYTLALRGGQPETGLTYQLSYERQATADPAGKTETGGSIGLMYDPAGGDGIALGNRLGVTPFIEYAQFNNFGNVANQRQAYVVGGLAFKYVRWELDVSGGVRKASAVPQDDGSVKGTFDRQQSVSLNYTLTPHWTAGVGVNHVNLSGRGSSWTGGPSATYNIAF